MLSYYLPVCPPSGCGVFLMRNSIVLIRIYTFCFITYCWSIRYKLFLRNNAFHIQYRNLEHHNLKNSCPEKLKSYIFIYRNLTSWPLIWDVFFPPTFVLNQVLNIRGIAVWTEQQCVLRHRGYSEGKTPIPEAARSEANVCGRSLAVITNSNLAESIDVLCCTSTGLCNAPIPHPGETYLVYMSHWVWSVATLMLYT